MSISPRGTLRHREVKYVTAGHPKLGSEPRQMRPGTRTGCDTVGWKIQTPPPSPQPPWRSVLLLPWCICFNVPRQALGIACAPAAQGTPKPRSSPCDGGRELKCCFRAVSPELTNKVKQMCKVGVPRNKAKCRRDGVQRASDHVTGDGESLPDSVIFEHRPKGSEEAATWRKSHPGERTAHAKVLGQWHASVFQEG